MGSFFLSVVVSEKGKALYARGRCLESPHLVQNLQILGANAMRSTTSSSTRSVPVFPEEPLLPLSSSGSSSQRRKRDRRLMSVGMGWGGVKRRTLLLGFSLALFLGVAVYLRIWAINDSSFSLDDREALRRQFDRANMEAMDESAEWRMKYDAEVARNRHYQEELTQVKDSLASANQRLTALQEENAALKKQLESLLANSSLKNSISTAIHAFGMKMGNLTAGSHH